MSPVRLFVVRNVVMFLSVFILGSVHAVSSVAQDQHSRDSIRRLIQKAPDDTASVISYLYFGELFLPAHTDSALYYYNRAASIAIRSRSDKHYMYYLQFLGDYYIFKSDFSRALGSFRKARDIAVRIRKGREVARILGDIGGVQTLIGNLDSGLFYYKLSMAEWQHQLRHRNDSLDLAVLYYQMCAIYQQQNLREEAYDYAKKTYELGRLTQEPEYEAFGLLGIASYEFYKKNWESALGDCRRAEELNLQAKNPVILLNSTQIAGDVYLEQKDYRAAERKYKQLVSLAKEVADPATYMMGCMSLASCYTQMGRLNEAEDYFKKSLKEAEANKRKVFMPQILGVGIDLYAAKKDYKTSFNLLKQLSALKEQMSSEDLRKDFQKLYVQYQTLQKDKQLAQSKLLLSRKDLKLQEQSKMVIASLLGLVIIIVMAAFIYINYKQKQQYLAQRVTTLRKEKEVQVLEAMIQGEENERTRIAKELHDGVGGMLSAVKMHFSAIKKDIGDPEIREQFIHALHLLDDTSMEVRKSAHNLMPEVLLKHGLDQALQLFCGNIGSSEALQVHYMSFGKHLRYKQSFELSVYRIVQELINNTIKHAKASEAIVQLNEQEGMLSIVVEDDGIGFNKDHLTNKYGMGLTNLRSRVGAMNGSLEFTTGEGNGTTAYIEFNVSEVKVIREPEMSSN